MRTRTIEIGKPGIYGTVDNPKVVTADDLREIYSTWPDIGRAPISLTGHKPDPKAGRLGNVTALHLTDDASSLAATVEEHDQLAEVVDNGFYPDRSLGAQRRASDGKLYLHHLAYLGEEPPAIKDLRDSVDLTEYQLVASDDDGRLIIIPPISARILTLADTGIKPDQQIPSKEKTMDLEEALAALEKEKAAKLELSDQFKKTSGELEAVTAAVKEKDELIGKLRTQYPDNELLLSDRLDPRVTQLQDELRQNKLANLRQAAAGKLPKGKMQLVDALAGQLSTTALIELSDGEKKTKVDGFGLVTQIFGAIPAPVSSGILNLGDEPEGGAVKFSGRDLLKNL